jgi:hypothetical protein
LNDAVGSLDLALGGVGGGVAVVVLADLVLVSTTQLLFTSALTKKLGCLSLAKLSGSTLARLG